jgi:hypothetical protein
VIGAAWGGRPGERADWRALVEYAGLVIVLTSLTKIPVSVNALMSSR